MFFTIYKITNLVNDKYYHGMHQTKNLDDGYMGSGKLLLPDIEKYGTDNFRKEILFIYDNEADMRAKEAEIVVPCWLDEQSYNLCYGGKGGWSHINQNRLNGFCNIETAKLGRVKTDEILKDRYGENWRREISKIASAAGNKSLKEKFKDPKFMENFKLKTLPCRIKAQSPEAREKRKQTMSKNGHSKCSKNSQYGKRWINNGEKSFTVPESELDKWYILGYTKGRKMF